MKNILCFIAVSLMGVAATFGQTVTLTFTAKDAANHYVQLNRVAITNLTKSWQEIIYWPDTTLTMQNGTGIDEPVTNGVFALSQNNPNPFSITTDVNLTVPEAGAVTLEISDVNGRTVETHNRASLQPGIHQFCASLSAPGTYVMTARQNGKTSSIKMVCNGGGSSNTIDYLGMVHTLTYVLKSSTTNPFNFGDMMEYVGYATINGTEAESQRITQTQGASQTFTLQFDVAQHYAPSVTTSSVSNISVTSATCGGNVTYDGGATVTARGVCWSTSQNPTVSGNHTTNGTGTGSFTSNITGLTANTTYYVRAYATNSAGTAYGSQKSFTTPAAQPAVTTNTVSNITATTTTCGGNVTSDGGVTVTARGVCWSNSQNPTVNGSHTTNGTGTGSFTSSLTGLSPNTTYYVRAYATNSVGTSYGEQLSFTTLATVPTVTTYTVSDITPTTALCGGSVTATGGATVTSRGVCWSTSQNPTVNGSHTTDGTGSGFFWSNLTGLSPSTTYYVRAYATNSAGTAYGSQRSFTTTTSLPTVSIWTPSNIMPNSATCGGNVSSEGIATVTARGVCWSTTQNPTISGSHTTDGTGTGSFTSSLTGLSPGTTYYVRAYATNSSGTAYSLQKSFTTPGCSYNVHTGSLSYITDTSATCAGEITYDCGVSVPARGVCWSTSQNPTVNDSHTTDGTGTGAGVFYSNLTGLTANTTYYVRAYATNSSGTIFYGETHSFVTSNGPCPGAETVTDIDNNTYNTVQIGNQCWMRENLRTTRYADGTNIALGSSTSDITAYRYYPGNNSSNVSTYGYLYNWKAVMGNSSSSSANPSGVQGICPTGWHVPSDSEWTQLTDYVSNQNRYWCHIDSSSTYIAKALASTTGWIDCGGCSTCDVSKNPSFNNTTGFTALPAGYYDGSYHLLGHYAHFWTTHSSGSNHTNSHLLGYSYPDVHSSYNFAGRGYSVRCVLGEGAQLPAVTTSPASNVTISFATCGGNVTSDGGASVTARGVCWSTSQNPTVSGSHTTNGSDTGSFTSSLTGLTANTTYYVRAYATNVAGTAYGQEVSFVTAGGCPGVETVTDIDNNTYNTVQIGNQCWMRENLRTTRYADGTTIELGSSTSNTTAYRYNPGNNSSNVSTYGYLYNWKAVMGLSASSSANPSGIIGICPTGWHVPSDAEWTQLINYVSSQSQYVCGNNNSYIAKALASITGWGSNGNVTCAVANNPSVNNATGFTALPAGRYSGSYGDFGSCAYFWTATTDGTYPYNRYIHFNSAEVEGNTYTKDKGYSVRCVLGEGPQLPTVTTSSASDVSATSATCGGIVTSEGGASVITRGVCWSTSQNPTKGDSYTTIINGGIGSFSSILTDLTPNTTYYVRAYATNNGGTTYGEQQSFSTLNPTPTVTTNNVYNINTTTATCGGYVSDNGVSAVTARGVCWSTSANPTVSNSHTSDGNGLGNFTSNITGLTANTTYYVRSYATNSSGTAYGEQRNFTTLEDGQPCPGVPTVTDIDNNTYNTVQIGSQCWMKENLRTTRYANGTNIALENNTSVITAYRYYPNNDSSNLSTYGYLYNWKAVMRNSSSSSANPSGVQGICPTGWHVPSNVEWTQLENYVSSQSQYVCGSDTTYIAKALAFTTGWESSTNTCAVGNNPSANNMTNFSILPAGNNYGNFGSHAYFWTSTKDNSGNHTYSRDLSFHIATVSSYTEYMGYGLSVRCLHNAGGSSTAQLPTVTTTAASNIQSITATCGGNVTSDGGATVTARGVCWSTSQNPTISGSHTTNDSGTGSFTSSITGLTASTTYYVRAYATNITGTAYGNEVSFTTPGQHDGQPCPEAATVTDIDNNTYNTVKIGNQCWMKESLRTTRYANGASIALGSGTSTTTAYRYCPNNDSSNVSTYGYLYNWKAVMGNSYSSSANPSGVQGICPSGWHVPSNAEWIQLTDYVSSQNQYWCGNSYTSIAKALASTMGWNNSTNTCGVGNNPSTNNATEFSALPAGEYSYSGQEKQFGERAEFWSSTDAYGRYVDYRWANVNTFYGNGDIGVSVRCVRDEGGSSAAQLPTVTTAAASSIETTTATCGGNVTSDGGATVTARGVCWSTTQNPTISGSHTTDGTGTGSFTSNLTGLTAGTTYYVRAYATNSVGTAYGSQTNFTTAVNTMLPVVTTNTVSNITETTATCGGNVTSDGGATVTARGVCWSTSQNPSVSDSHTTNGTGTGSFTSSLTGLTPSTTYYVRAYATNSVGTAYGSEVSLTTTDSSTTQDGLPCPEATTVTDIDNNTYNTVKIGNQCWMKENLRTTRYANGTSIALGSSTSTTTAYRYYPNNSLSNVATYGYLYNWKAVMGNSSSSSANPSGVQGICPTGWHVPSDAEWTQLTDYVSSQNQYVCGSDSTYIAKALASITDWESSTYICAVGNNPSANNATGFSALPAGSYYGNYSVLGYNAYFWSTTLNGNNSFANYRRLVRDEANVKWNISTYSYGYSVRCLRD